MTECVCKLFYKTLHAIV